MFLKTALRSFLYIKPVALIAANQSRFNIRCERLKEYFKVMGTKLLSLLLLILFCDQIVGEEGYFTVIGSNLIRVGKPYEGAINYHGYVNEKTLEISIKSKTEEETDEEISAQNISFIGTGSKNFKFDVSLINLLTKKFK